MMNEQGACEGGAGASSGLLMRRRSKDWILPHTPAVGTTASRNGESNVANTSSGATTSTFNTTVAASNTKSCPTQFMELIEMLFCCYLEQDSPQRSEHYRNLVEVVLKPIFDHLETRNNKIPATTRTPATMNSGVTSVATPSQLVGPSTMRACPDVSPCNSRNGINSTTSSVATGPSSPPTATVVVTPGGQNTVGIVGHSSSKNESEINSDLYSSLLCPVCYGIFVEPVTIQCGHSYCKKCLQKQVASKSCRRCNYFLTNGEASQCKTNVLLGELVEKWWPDHVTASRLRSEGNKTFEEKQVDTALAKYTQALNLVPEDHLSFGNRSNCLLNAGKSEEALRDAEAAIKSCPIWPKGYFRKSAALISLGRFKEAFLSLTVCMYLTKLNPFKKVYPSSSPSSPPIEDPDRTQVINEMIKVLQKTFLQSASSAMGSTLKRHNVGSEKIQYTPYPGARSRGSAAFNRQGWNNSSEHNSSGDEGDHAIWSHNQQNHSRKSSKSHNHHHQYREQNPQRSSSSSSSSVVEQLSARMGRLFTRASQDLKSFDMRLRGDGGHVQGIKPILNVQPPREVSCNDVECSLCYRLLFQPVSTECGHTFCRSCLDRCMDHNPSCPLCKTGLQSYLACREHAVTEFLEDAIKMFLPKEFEERLKQHMEELNSVANTEGKDVDVDVPIFVCTMAFPTIPCPLHVFEPRYRLMIRRCMENGSNRFGMCCYFSEGENNYGEIGTLLEIRNIQYFADGRSVVDTVGCRRFKVVHKNVVDGYNTARIELLHDKTVLESEIPVVQHLHDSVLREATGWLQSIGQVRRQRIHSHFGTMPDPEEDWLGSPDGPSWTWWLLAILPLDSKAQLAILSMCSLQKRLECILKVLNFVKNRMGADKE